MLTFFTMPKPFWGHIGIIQRNAIQSWLQLGSDIEIILCGDEEGTAEIAREFDLIHAPDIECNEYGTPLVNSIFTVAEAKSRHPFLCYINTDIILLSDFLNVLEATKKNKPFLIIGERWDLDVTEPIDFTEAKWEKQLVRMNQEHGILHAAWGIDYFLFPKGLFKGMPPFAIGRMRYDNWFIYWARYTGARVIDASKVSTCIHQNHDYSFASVGLPAPKGDVHPRKGLEAKKNLKLAGGYPFLFNKMDANWVLTENGLAPIPLTFSRFYDGLFRFPVLLPKVGPILGVVSNPLVTVFWKCREKGFSFVDEGKQNLKEKGGNLWKGLNYCTIGLTLWPFRMDLYSRAIKHVFYKLTGKSRYVDH